MTETKRGPMDSKRMALIDCQERMWKIFCLLAFRVDGPPYEEFLEYLDLREKSYELISKMDV